MLIYKAVKPRLFLLLQILLLSPIAVGGWLKFYCNLLMYDVIIIANLILVNTLCVKFSFFIKRGIFLLLTERIKMLAEPLHMTFASIERDVGIGRGTIRKWDMNCPSADKLLKVADLLNTTMDYLMTGKKDMLSEPSISDYDSEWLMLIHQLPIEIQYEFRGEIKGYLKSLNYESVTSDEPLRKTGTDSLGK